MLNKHTYFGKTKEETIEKAKINLQEYEENLIINIKEEKKKLLTKKVEIEVIEKREVKEYLKILIKNLLTDLGYETKIELTTTNDIPTYRIYSNNDSLLIGKNGKNLYALTTVVNAILTKEINNSFRFLIDVNYYKEKNDEKLLKLAKKIAKEVKDTKVEVKLDSMNSYQRRIVHNALSQNKYVYTESIGEEPNRCVVIKPND